MNDNKQNQSATELWEQIFARAAKEENAAVWDPDYAPSDEGRKLRDGLRNAGWSDEEIEERLKIDRARIAATSAPEGVNPHVHAQYTLLCNDVEAAMDRMHLNSHARVARGIEPRIGPIASKTNVIMTRESIVTVGAHLFRFCGLIARTFTRSLMLDAYRWSADSYTEADGRNLFRRAPYLLRDWNSIFLSYAVSGTNFYVPFKPAKKHEVLLFEQVARAMEIFAISHEYGHHEHDHGRSLESDAHAEEFEADQFALRVCREVERRPFIFENPYLSSGAGGTILLLALRTLRGLERLIAGGTQIDPGTHPDPIARIARFNSVAVWSRRNLCD